MAKIGELGEKFVGQWLENKGYLILHYNWRCQWGEIDLIAQNKTNSELIFVEVKTRSNNNWDENGLLAITPKKQAKIQTTIEIFFSKHPHFVDFPCRIDVAIVNYSQNEFRLKDYIESAF
jgi:putative endonuclease